MSHVERGKIIRYSEEFLFKSCMVAQGNIRKNINILDIYKKIRLIYRNIPNEHLPQILEYLKVNDFIEIELDTTFSVTYKGIYHIGEKRKYPLEKLGIIPIKELEMRSEQFYSLISKESQKNKLKLVNTNEIHKKADMIIDDNMFYQLIKLLEDKNKIGQISKICIRLKLNE